MSGTVKTLLVIVGVVVLAVSVYVVRLMTQMGQFTTITPQFDGTCTKVAGATGPEDVLIDRERNVAYVSAYDRRAAMAGENVRGGLYRFDLSGTDYTLTPLASTVPADFRPHGISLFIAEDGTRSLFAINHPAAGGHTIEIFDSTDGETWTHRDTITDPLFTSPNDLVAVGPRQFYVGNDHFEPEGFGRTLEDYLRQDKTTVVYFDGEGARIVADGLTYANGINVSADGQTLYLAETTDRALRIYDRDPASGDLTQRDYVFLGTGLDNIDIDEDGAIWIGTHPKMFDFIAHAGDASELSPSQIIRLNAFEGGGGEARTVYLNLGDEISGASVGAHHDGKLVIGAVFEPHFLVCDMAQ